jgi:glycolate oxidase FAD binding subunit
VGVTLETAREPLAYALGERVPARVLVPRDADEVATMLRACDDAGEAVVLFGGNTLQALANPPTRYDVALDLRGLANVVAYEPNDLTIAVEAGMTVARLDAALAEHRQFVPLDAPRALRATVGGTLASGWLGPRRNTYGRARDFVIGSTAALADGTLAKSGGMVVKNVTGYDLSKLYVGSLGTLGAIVRANFKTLPLPQARRVAIATLPERTRVRAVANLRALDVEPTAALIVRGFTSEIDGRDGIDGRVFVLFEGSARAIDRATRELRSALGSAGVPETRLIDRDVDAAFARVLDAYVAQLGDRSATFRSPGFPSDTGERFERFLHAARASEMLLETIEDVRTGDAIARVSTPLTADFPERLRTFERERRETLREARVLAAPRVARSILDAWTSVPETLATMRALKTRFDPRATFAPGRYVGGI